MPSIHIIQNDKQAFSKLPIFHRIQPKEMDPAKTFKFKNQWYQPMLHLKKTFLPIITIQSHKIFRKITFPNYQICHTHCIICNLDNQKISLSKIMLDNNILISYNNHLASTIIDLISHLGGVRPQSILIKLRKSLVIMILLQFNLPSIVRLMKPSQDLVK